MARIEELPDDGGTTSETRNATSTAPVPPAKNNPATGTSPAAPQTPPAPSPSSTKPALPPAIADIHDRDVDHVVNLINRTPLFMSSLDDAAADDGEENIDLEALKALAYEGTPFEVADNFREQGNDLFKLKKWVDAREFYDKGLAVLEDGKRKRAAAAAAAAEEGVGESSATEEDGEQRAKERKLEESLLLNRAACNLELQNYRRVTHDSAAAIHLNPLNPKPYYRSGQSLLALSKTADALDAVAHGLRVDPRNAALKNLHAKIGARIATLDAEAKSKREREERRVAETKALAQGLRMRGIRTRKTAKEPDLEDAAVHLAEPLDPTSELSFPVLVLYPLMGQSDFVKAVPGSVSVGEQLAEVLPPPWDEAGEYRGTGSVDCYMETASGGLVKVGKKVGLEKVLEGGKVEVVDSVVKILVVPRSKAAAWIEEFKKRAGKG